MAAAGGGATPCMMKLLCSHGGRFVPSRATGGAPRYAGGETRALAVPRDASFGDLTARLAEACGGAGLEDVLVSVTCDEELAHMRDERSDALHDVLLCSHGGRFIPPRATGGAPRYAGGETRALAVPRDASFRDLAARLAEVCGGAGTEVRALAHRLADSDGAGLEDVLVSVTCDEELAHMRDEYDRLRATRPSAKFRVFVVTAAAAATGPSDRGGEAHRRIPLSAPGLPPLPPSAMRRAQSEQALAARAHRQQHRPMRRVQSAHVLPVQAHHPSVQHRRHQQCCRCPCQRRDVCAPAPPPVYAPPYTSKKAAPAPPAPAAKAAGRVASTEATRETARSRDAAARAAAEDRRAIWEFQ